MLPARRTAAQKPRKEQREPKVRRVCLPHQRWIRTEWACTACGSFGDKFNPIEAAHLRLGTGGGMGLKPSDRWILPLCHRCHNADQHQRGEVTFYRKLGIADPKAVCDGLARKSPHWPKLRDMP